MIGDTLLPESRHAALLARFPYVQMRRQTLPFKFACPSGVLRSGTTNWAVHRDRLAGADAVEELQEG